MVRQPSGALRHLRLFALAAPVLLIAPRALGQKAEDAYRTDDRLKVAVTLSLRDTAFADVTRALGKVTGVPLSAGQAVADDHASIFVKSMPARDFMAVVASHFGCRWRAGKGGYVLEMTSVEATREATLARQAREQALASLDAKLRAMQRLLNTPDAELKSRARDLSAALASPDLAPETRKAVRAEVGAIQRMSVNTARAAIAVFSALTPRQLADLREGSEVRLDSLDPETSAMVTGALGGPGRASQATSDPHQRQDAASSSAILSVETDDAGVYGADGQSRQVALRVQLRVPTSGEGHGFSGSDWVLESLMLDSKPSPRMSSSTDPDLNRSVEIPALASAEQDHSAPYADQLAARPTLGALLAQLHAATGLSICSDSFIRTRVVVPAGKHSVLELLNTVCGALHYSWHKQGDTILLRSDRFYIDRLMEAPDRILHPLRRQFEAGTLPGIDEYAAIAAALTDRQLYSLNVFWESYLSGTPVARPGSELQFYSTRHDLRLWALLSAPQRQAALRGEPLRVATLSQPQATAFARAAAADDELSPVRSLTDPGVPTRADIASGAFRLAITRTLKLTSPPGSGGGRTTIVREGEASGRASDGGDLSAMRRQTIERYSFQYLVAGGSRTARTRALSLVTGAAHPPAN